MQVYVLVCVFVCYIGMCVYTTSRVVFPKVVPSSSTYELGIYKCKRVNNCKKGSRRVLPTSYISSTTHAGWRWRGGEERGGEERRGKERRWEEEMEICSPNC
ncbi:hypothetical protein F5X96DRAFT_130782 [Biscogniauxia mediterranea]|nr:hypothetical protein F5X96DRAFT_130782 [Biscogniauxia mediterranea]